MDCPTCATSNEPDRRFCKECGTPLTLVCPSCGTANSPDSKFCGGCGSALDSAGPTVSDAAPRTERRLVSVLFVDLVGFTTLSEHRDAEDVRELLGRYFETARVIVERHAGLVEKFIGDAVMAVWGTPTAHEDDAERAVRAALEIVAAVRALGRSVGAKLDARGGVLTGEAAATVGAVSQGIVAGDLVNTASRLQSVAEPGTVLVGEATYRAASRAISFTEIEPRVLKGKAGPVRAWLADRVIAQRRGQGRSATLEPPFVGRVEELHLIKQLLHASERDRKARLLSIVGMGGIGKSRLVWEFQKYIDGLVDDIFWHQGRCPAYGDGVTFWALGEMVRMRAGVAEADDPATSRRAVSETLRSYVLDDDERRWIEPRLMHLLALADRPPGEPEELFAAWRMFFERIAEQGPTVLVFEDVQWADSGLLDFIESILEWSRDRPILVIVLARPELADRRPSWGAELRNFTSLHLDPLSDETMTQLVEGFVRGLAREDVERFVVRAEGVPLYAIETVRMLADRGIVRAGETAYEIVGDVGELDVPETLQALIASRLDALAPDARALVQDASVLGKSFPLDALVAVSDRPRQEVEAMLRELVRRDVLEQEADRRSPERGQYSFVQSLIREVAYGTLAKADRRRKHLATAHYFESLEDEELAGIVATHYVEAFEATAAGPEADSLAARARDWLSAAADRALSLGSPEQSLAFLEQALSITLSGEERASLLRRAGESLMRAGRLEEGVVRSEEAIAAYRELGQLAPVARITARLQRPLATLGRLSESIERLEAVRAELPEGSDADLGRADVDVALAYARRDAGDEPDASLRLAEEALAIAERMDEPELLIRALDARAASLWQLGRHREASILGGGILALAQAGGFQEEIAAALMGLAVSSAEDDPKEAFERFWAAVQVARRGGMRPLEIMNLSNAAEAAYGVGKWKEADEALAALEGRQLSGHLRQASLITRAMLDASRGDASSAFERLREADRGAEGAESMVDMKAWVDRARSIVCVMDGSLDEAFDHAIAAVEISPTGINAPLAVWSASIAALWARDRDRAERCLGFIRGLRGRWIDAVGTVVSGGIAALTGEIGQGADLLRDGIDRFADLDVPFDLALAVSIAVTVLPAEEVSEETIDRARSILRDLGAAPVLERLEAAIRAPSEATTEV